MEHSGKLMWAGFRAKGKSSTGPHRVLISTVADQALGMPDLIEADYDEERQAIKFTSPPSAEDRTYQINREPRTRFLKRARQPELYLSISRSGYQIAIEPVDMPNAEERYGYIGDGVFVHESRLNRDSVAQLARLLLCYEDPATRFPTMLSLLRFFRNWDGPDLVCPIHDKIQMADVRMGPKNHTSFRCKHCDHTWEIVQSPYLPRRRKALVNAVRALHYYVHNRDHDVGNAELSKALGLTVNQVRPFRHLKRFLPPDTGDFHWRPYYNSKRSRLIQYLRAYPHQLKVTHSVWEQLGQPRRVNITADPLEATITLRPDPQGGYTLHPHRLDRVRSPYQATVASLEDSAAVGVYVPISLGRFEGVFKYEKALRSEPRRLESHGKSKRPQPR